MKKQHQNITYTVVDPNTDRDFKNALKQIIVEKLLLIQRDMPL